LDGLTGLLSSARGASIAGMFHTLLHCERTISCVVRSLKRGGMPGIPRGATKKLLLMLIGFLHRT
jgi:hypothetical protein